ncbi:MAG: hypothetical protein QOJ13_1732 [Gaiellales bacterium]|jgi:hypothetical protein|nr:hypothetical protein [Gaiellales bacterium]
MSPVFLDSAEATEELSAFISRFLESEEGIALGEAAAGLEFPTLLELRVTGPDAVVFVDFAQRRLVDRPDARPGAAATIDADSLHHLLMDQLGPIEISRLAEEGRVHLEGPPLVLGGLLVVCSQIQPHYRASLEERGRQRLLDAPAPVTGAIWKSDLPSPPMFGVRRPWQRPKGEAAAASP